MLTLSQPPVVKFLAGRVDSEADMDASPTSHGFAGQPVEYFRLRGRPVLRPEAGGADWYWAVNPYQGCELGCIFCHARLERPDFAGWRSFESRIGHRQSAVEQLVKEIHAHDFAGRQVVLGTTTEPWQPAEEKYRLTRAVLEAMARVEDVDLHVNTRASLVARDCDVLKAISDAGHVRVAISLCSLDERVTRVMEPKAPSPLRRLAAMEALARAGVPVGVMVSPLLPGIDEDELGLEAMLTRATHAGARFASMELLTFAPGQREVFLAHASAAYPKHAMKLRRMAGVKPASSEQKAELRARFDAVCAQLGLMPLHREPRPVRQRLSAVQLPLFAP